MIIAISISTIIFGYLLRWRRWAILTGLLCAALGAITYYAVVVLEGGTMSEFVPLGIYVTFLLCLHVNALIQAGYSVYRRQFSWKGLVIWWVLLVPLDIFSWWTLAN